MKRSVDGRVKQASDSSIYTADTANINRFLIERSLGQRRSKRQIQWPQVPVFSLSDIERVNSSTDIRAHVLLGFVPRYPKYVISVAKCRRRMFPPLPLLEGMIQSPTARLPQNVEKTRLWHFDPATLKITSYNIGSPVCAHLYSSLIRVSSAITLPKVEFSEQRQLIALTQINNYDDIGGVVELIYIPDITSAVNDDINFAYLVCSTLEAYHIQPCYSMSHLYTAVLMETRCLFLLSPDATHELEATGVKSSKRSYWTKDANMGCSENPYDSDYCFWLLEVDILIETLLRSNSQVFGTGYSAGWRYVLLYDSRSEDDLQRLIRAAEQKRGDRVQPGRGCGLVVCVLADDDMSILIATLLVDPTAVGTTFNDCLVLDARRCRLKRPVDPDEDLGLVMRKLLVTAHGVQYDQKHDCRMHCADKHKINGTTVLPEYDPKSAVSLDLLEGDYWSFSNEKWG